MKQLLLAILLVASTQLDGQILPLREQAKVIDEVLADRLNNLLPILMERNGIDMWVMITREYNEDPIVKTMLPATWLNARRRTIIVFYNNFTTHQFKKLAVTRYAVGTEIEAAWDMKKYPDQWDALLAIINQYNPTNIALNISDNLVVNCTYSEWSKPSAWAKLSEMFKAIFVGLYWLIMASNASHWSGYFFISHAASISVPTAYLATANFLNWCVIGLL